MIVAYLTRAAPLPHLREGGVRRMQPEAQHVPAHGLRARAAHVQHLLRDH